MPPKGKGKEKEKVSSELQSSKPKAKTSPSSNDECFHFKGKGLWSRNCKKYLEHLKKKKGSATSTSGIYITEINIVYLLVIHGYLIPDR